MKLSFPKRDNRSHMGRNDPITDEDTGEVVGRVYSEREFGRDVSLFDGKYSASLDTHDAAWGFVKGVEAVLNHMVSRKDAKASEAA